MEKVKQVLTSRKAAIVAVSVFGGLFTISLVLGVSGYIAFPESIGIGPLQIRLYSISIVLGLLAGIAVFEALKSEHKDLAKLDVWDAVFYAVIPGIIGARIYHVLTDFYLYQDNLLGMFEIWNGGIGFIGGVIGGGLGLAWYLRKHKLDILKVFGLLTIAIPIAQAIGRLGNFFNKELFGIPTDLPWGLYVSPEQNPFPFLRNFSYFHPLFLYEALANILLAALLLNQYKRGTKSSTLIIFYISGYGLIRYTLDFFRIDGRSGVAFLSYAQWIVLGWFVFAAVFGLGYQVWYRRKYGEWFTKKKR